MKLIAKKPCSFGGMRFYIGDEIPADLVMNPREQEKMDVLVLVEDAPAPITITVKAEEGDMPLEPTVEGLQAIFDILTCKPEEAKPIIENMTDGDALILLHMSDSRKAIKTAAEARAKAINEAGEA